MQFVDVVQETTTGERKILDLVDTTGSGDVDTSTVVRCEVNEDGKSVIQGLSGRSLVVPDGWNNPSGEWHIGIKAAFELFPGNLKSRLQVVFVIMCQQVNNYTHARKLWVYYSMIIVLVQVCDQGVES